MKLMIRTLEELPGKVYTLNLKVSFINHVLCMKGANFQNGMAYTEMENLQYLPWMPSYICIRDHT